MLSPRREGGAMQPLALDDLLPIPEYAARRAEFFRAHVRYLDRYRRVRLGPRVSLIFENRQTLWFRLQEVLLVARLVDAGRVRQELDWYNRLLPRRNLLQAALVIERGAEPLGELDLQRALANAAVELRIGEAVWPARFVTPRAEGCCVGSAHWLELPLDLRAKAQLADGRRSARFLIVSVGYEHESAPLNPEVRQSLVDDLELSERVGELRWAA